jgi:DNA-binding CsgD family transcriptional regulator
MTENETANQLPSEAHESARGLRAQLKNQQSEQANMRLFNLFGKQLFTQGWSNAVAEDLLQAICHRLGAVNGLIAQQSMGTLTVLASYGKTYPQAARIPIIGGLGSILKNPCTLETHYQGANFWLDNNPQTLVSCILPLASGGQSNGILAFARLNQKLNEAESILCETLAGLIGSALTPDARTQHQTQADLKQLNTLTPREREIFALMPSGYSNAELGELLGISGGTAKIHVERILAKLNLRDRTQAAVKAVELGYKSTE